MRVKKAIEEIRDLALTATTGSFNIKKTNASPFPISPVRALAVIGIRHRIHLP